MNKSLTRKLLKLDSVIQVEKHLVYSYLKFFNISTTKNPIIKEYIKDFQLNNNLLESISRADLGNLKDLEHHLELLIPLEDRKHNGAFFTPDYIVDYMIQELSPLPRERCIDISCGCGAFLIGLLKYYQENYNQSVKETLRNNIFGIDILEYNITRTKILLSIYGLENEEIIKEDDFNLDQMDSLRNQKWDKFDIVVGNPPYVKFQDLNNPNRTYLKENFESIGNGSFNLYFAFFELGYSILTPQGRLGYITPNNYFTSLAGKSLRKFFRLTNGISTIVDFKHRKVFDAQTYTAITFMNRNHNLNIRYERLSGDETSQLFLSNLNFSDNPIQNLNDKKWRLLKDSERDNIETLENSGHSLKELFNISAGIATLKDEIFFVDGSTENNGFLRKENSKGIFYIESEITKPVYKISNLKSQDDVLNNTLRIITPYQIDDGQATPIQEKMMAEKFPRCYEYLLSVKDILKKRDKEKKQFKPFYIWGRSQGITRQGIRILNPTFSKKPRFLISYEGDSFFTNGYGLFFKNTENHLLAQIENIEELQKVLNSKLMDYYVRVTSVSIEGDYPCYQKNFIEKFTIPPFNNNELNELRNLEDDDEINSFLSDKYQVRIF